MTNQPTYLKEGDKVALVSPAYWMPEDTLMQAAEIIRSWGLQPAIGPHTIVLSENLPIYGCKYNAFLENMQLF